LRHCARLRLFGLSWDVRHDIQVPAREEFEGIEMIISVMDLTAGGFTPG
jgi:hypothetical protein